MSRVKQMSTSYLTASCVNLITAFLTDNSMVVV